MSCISENDAPTQASWRMLNVEACMAMHALSAQQFWSQPLSQSGLYARNAQRWHDCKNWSRDRHAPVGAF